MLAKVIVETLILSLLQVVELRDKPSDDECESIFGNHDAVERALEACELLAHTSCVSRIPAMMRFFSWLENEGKGDTFAVSGPQIISCFDPEAAMPILESVIDSRGNPKAKCTIADGLRELVGDEPAIQKELAPLIIRGLENPRKLPPELNSQLMMLAMDWQLTDAAEVIERAFSANRIDCGMAGDWRALAAKFPSDWWRCRSTNA